MSSNYRQLVLIGGRGVALATIVTSLFLAVQPIDWSTVDPKFIVASFFALATWTGLEFNQYYLNYKPTEHPSDINLARSILNKIHLNDLYFFENFDFGDSFRLEEIDGAKYLYGFTLVDRKHFHSQALEKKFNEVTKSSSRLVSKIGERGEHHPDRPFYMVIRYDEYRDRKMGMIATEETEDQIRDVIDLSHEFASKFKELHQLLLELLPSAFEEEK